MFRFALGVFLLCSYSSAKPVFPVRRDLIQDAEEFPPTLEWDVDGIHILLSRKTLLGEDYADFDVDTDFNFQESTGNPYSQGCYYSGEIPGVPDAIVAAMLCTGMHITALLPTNGTAFILEPHATGTFRSLTELPAVEHNLTRFTLNAQDLSDLVQCGIGDDLRRATEHDDETIAAVQSTEIESIHYLALNDFARYNRFKTQTTEQTLIIFNMMSEMYARASFIRPVRIILSAQASWKQADPFQSVTDSYDLLSKFNNFRRQGSLPAHDVAQFFSARRFASGISGLAGVGTMCDHSQSGGVCSLRYDNVRNAVISAHELGHSFGMLHDGTGNECDQHSFIMGPQVSTRQTFSPCSVAAMNRFLRNGDQCLKQNRLQRILSVAEHKANKTLMIALATVFTILGVIGGMMFLYCLCRRPITGRPTVGDDSKFAKAHPQLAVVQA